MKILIILPYKKNTNECLNALNYLKEWNEQNSGEIQIKVIDES